jgi:hypothetical protein
MNRLHLIPKGSARAHLPMEHVGLLVEWDELAGAFSGRDADRARKLVDAAVRDGLVGPDAMRSRAALAAVFAPIFELPPILEAVRPSEVLDAAAEHAAVMHANNFGRPVEPFRASPPAQSNVTVSQEDRPAEESRRPVTSRASGYAVSREDRPIGFHAEAEAAKRSKRSEGEE